MELCASQCQRRDVGLLCACAHRGGVGRKAGLPARESTVALAVLALARSELVCCRPATWLNARKDSSARGDNHPYTPAPPSPVVSTSKADVVFRSRRYANYNIRLVVPRGPAPPEPAEPLTPWGYPTPPCPSAAPWTPSKRNISESDDCDDVFSESSKEPSSDRDLNPNLPVIGSIVYCESSTLDHAAINLINRAQTHFDYRVEAQENMKDKPHTVHPYGIRNLISSSLVNMTKPDEDNALAHMTVDADGDSYQLLSRKKRRGIIEKRRRDRINTSLTELRRLVPAAYEKQGSAKLEKAEILQLTVDHLKMLHAKGMDVLTCDPHKFAMDYHNLGFRECASEVARYLVTVEGLDIQDPLRLRLMSHLQCFAAQRELATKQSSGNVPWSYGPADPGNCVSQHYSPPTTAQQPPPPPPPSYDSPHVPTSSSASSNLAASYSQSHAHAHYPSNPDPHHQTSAYSSPSGASPSHVKPYRPWGAELAY
uniref:(California timema) hypothetical protein n=1 Tax=Timema californicum TaxID=61474 RepID=A0A7R9P7L3_TIMCA|nr:unnamed protein product [Timema californicum]